MRATHVLLFAVALALGGCASEPAPDSRPAPAEPAVPPPDAEPELSGAIVIKGSKEPAPSSDDEEKRREEVERLEREARESQGGDHGKPVPYRTVSGAKTPTAIVGSWTVFDAPEGSPIDSIDQKEITATIETRTVNRGSWKNVKYRATTGWIHAKYAQGPHLTQSGTGRAIVLYDAAGVTQVATAAQGTPVRIVDAVQHRGNWWYHVATPSADGWTRNADP